MKLVTFAIADKEYALNIEQISEVRRKGEVTVIPKAPDFVEGVISLRERVVVLVNLRKKFGLEKSKFDNLSRVIITQVNTHLVGIIVDRICDVISFEAGQIEPPEPILEEATYLMGMGKVGSRLIFIIDSHKLLAGEGNEDISQLDEEIVDEENKIISEHPARELEIEEEKKDTIRVLTFLLGQENYCFDIRVAKEVFRPGQITRVPNTPDFVVGVTNFKGEILPLIDIRYAVGLAVKEMPKDIMVIVTDVRMGSIGIVVDKIKETLDIDKRAIQPPLATITGSLAQFTKGQIQLEDGILVLLSLEDILVSEELENLRLGGGRYG